MILREHIESHDRMKKYCQDPMLMLGNQENKLGYKFTEKGYYTLDPDGGDIRENCDLNLPLENHLLIDKWKTVYNLGTIEHVWNVHQAFVNATRFLKVGGHYLHHGPCAGYEGHGVHVSDPGMVLAFFYLNGFKILEYWYTRQDGTVCDAPERGDGNIILWFVAQKISEVKKFTVPQQVFVNGVKL